MTKDEKVGVLVLAFNRPKSFSRLIDCLLKNTNEEIFIETPIPNCSEPTNMSITFSTYGTYTFFFQGGSDGTIIEEVEKWDWLNDNQTEIVIGGGDGYDFDANGDGVIDSLDAGPYLTIQSITDDSLIMTISHEAYISEVYSEDNYPAYTETYTLSPAQ